jgi:hypothetical protein
MKYLKYQEPSSKLQNPKVEDKNISWDLGFGFFNLDLEIYKRR